MENDQNQVNNDVLNNWFGRLMVNEVTDEVIPNGYPYGPSF
jgi:hypothetical protein